MVIICAPVRQWFTNQNLIWKPTKPTKRSCHHTKSYFKAPVQAFRAFRFESFEGLYWLKGLMDHNLTGGLVGNGGMGWIYTSDYGSFPHSLRLAPASKLNDSNNSDESDIHKYTWVVFRGHLFLYKHLFSRFAACKRTCFAGERTCTPVNGIMLVFEFFLMNHWKCRSPRYPSQGPRNEQIQYWTGCSNLCHASTWVQNMLWSTLTKRNAHNGPPDQRFLHVAFRDVIWKHLVMGVEIVSFESKDLQTVWFKGLFFERWVSTMSCICHSLRSTRLSSGFSQGKRSPCRRLEPPQIQMHSYFGCWPPPFCKRSVTSIRFLRVLKMEHGLLRGMFSMFSSKNVVNPIPNH